jgi:hypothetical protein
MWRANPERMQDLKSLIVGHFDYIETRPPVREDIKQMNERRVWRFLESSFSRFTCM